jgi:hypothetical protein
VGEARLWWWGPHEHVLDPLMSDCMYLGWLPSHHFSAHCYLLPAEGLRHFGPLLCRWIG